MKKEGDRKLKKKSKGRSPNSENTSRSSKSTGIKKERTGMRFINNFRRIKEKTPSMYTASNLSLMFKLSISETEKVMEKIEKESA